MRVVSESSRQSFGSEIYSSRSNPKRLTKAREVQPRYPDLEEPPKKYLKVHLDLSVGSDWWSSHSPSSQIESDRGSDKHVL